MDTSHILQFSYTSPAVEGEKVEFRGIHRHADCEIHIAASAPVDRTKIDTSASDITLTYPVGHVDFSIYESGEERLGLIIARTDTLFAEVVHTQHPRAHYDDYLPQIDRCRELSAVLFEKGLTVTWYQTQHGEAA